jgi:hypothetical protein
MLWFAVDTAGDQVYKLSIAAQSSLNRRDDEGFEESSAVESGSFASQRIASHSRHAGHREGPDPDPGDDAARTQDSGEIVSIETK